MRFQTWLASVVVVACLIITGTPAVAMAQTTHTTAPTTHSYDDTHTSEDRSDSLPALWILTGAVGALTLIAVGLIRSGNSRGRHYADHE